MLIEVGHNLFLVYLEVDQVEERCVGQTPTFSPVTTAISLVQITPECLLDARNFQIEATTYRVVNSTSQSRHLLKPVLLDDWAQVTAVNISDVFLENPHLSQLRVPSFEHLTTYTGNGEKDRVEDIMNDSAYRWYTDWTVYIIAGLAMAGVTLFIWYRMKEKIHRKLPPKTKRIDTSPDIELTHQSNPDITTRSLYAPIYHTVPPSPPNVINNPPEVPRTSVWEYGTQTD